MLLDKLVTNHSQLISWIQKENIEAYRLFDREDPNLPLAIDIYGKRAIIYLYETDKPISEESLIEESIVALKSLLNISEKDCTVKLRKRQKKGEQYQKLANSKERFIIQEYGVKYYINLTDYLDTGLFLDHRETRKILPAYLKNSKRLLNLFAYTGAFSLRAAKLGVEFTTSVDMSNTYCDWAKDNIKLNGLDPFKHIVIRENVMFFFENIKQKKWKFDTVIIDPPTASRSKKMLEEFDVQSDHPYLINQAWGFLNPGGKILFSTNFTKFKLNLKEINAGNIKDITEDTFPPDFKNKDIHKVYIIE